MIDCPLASDASELGLSMLRTRLGRAGGSKRPEFRNRMDGAVLAHSILCERRSSSDIRTCAMFTITGDTRMIRVDERAFLSEATVGAA